MATVLEADIKTAVGKTNTPTLIAEIIIAQDAIDESVVKKLSRELLVSIAIALRKAANQATPVKSLISNFVVETDLADRIKKHLQEAATAETSQSEILKVMFTWMQDEKTRQLTKEANERKEKADELTRQLAKKADDKKERADELARINAKDLADKTERDAKEIIRKKDKDDKSAAERQNLLDGIKLVNDELRLKTDQAKTRRSEEEGRRDSKMKRAIKSTTGLFYSIPTKPIALITYFRNADQIFADNKIEDELKIHILTPHLQESARKIIAGLPDEDKSSYVKWRQSLLREHHVTARKCRKSFMNIHKSVKETCVQFLARLRTFYNCYLETRGVEKTYPALLELIVADRFRDSLTKEERTFVANQETERYLTGAQLARSVDVYQVEQQDFEDDTTDVFRHRDRTKFRDRSYKHKDRGRQDNYARGYRSEDTNKSYNFNKHKKNDEKQTSDKDKKSIPRTVNKNDSKDNTSKNRQMKVRVVDVDLSSEDISSSEDSSSSQYSEEEEEKVDINRVSIQEQNDGATNHNWVKNKSVLSNVVNVDFGLGTIPSILDSGAQISVVRPEMIKIDHDNKEEAEATIMLKSAFGKKVKARLRTVKAKLTDDT